MNYAPETTKYGCLEGTIDGFFYLKQARNWLAYSFLSASQAFEVNKVKKVREREGREKRHWEEEGKTREEDIGRVGNKEKNGKKKFFQFIAIANHYHYFAFWCTRIITEQQERDELEKEKEKETEKEKKTDHALSFDYTCQTQITLILFQSGWSDLMQNWAGDFHFTINKYTFSFIPIIPWALCQEISGEMNRSNM